MKTTVYSSFPTTPLLTRAGKATRTMRRTLTTCSAAALLGIVALAGGCMDPAAIEEHELEEADLDELDELAALDEDELDEDELDEDELDDAALDDAELIAVPDPMASCALWSGYTAGDPSPTFPATEHPVVGFKPDTELKLDIFGYYFEYYIELCVNGYGHSNTYYRYVSGMYAGAWLDERFPGFDPI